MATYDLLKAVPDQALEVLAASQDIFLTGAWSLVEMTRTVTPPRPPLPFASQLPDPVAITASAFAFAEKLFANQRDFSIKLLGVYLPAKAQQDGLGNDAPGNELISGVRRAPVGV